MKFVLSATIAAMAALAEAKTTAEWKQRTVYQVLTDRFSTGNATQSKCTNLSVYCGGNYKGLISELPYIQGMGFDAIWISPVVTNYPNSYHGYHATNWNTYNSNFGSQQDLQDFVNACHAKGIWVMVDVVANHVGPVGTNYSQITPYNQASHYHTDC
jgi:alpha-amylase